MIKRPFLKGHRAGLPSRRAVLGAASGAGAAGVLMACGGGPQSICAVAPCTGDSEADAAACTTNSFTVPDADMIPVGQVRVIGAEQTFLVRQAGGFAALSTRCRHAGCTVEYKAATQTFDCPCHGARYRLDGSVLRAPADTPQLEPLLSRAACRHNGLITISRTQLVKGAALVK